MWKLPSIVSDTAQSSTAVVRVQRIEYGKLYLAIYGEELLVMMSDAFLLDFAKEPVQKYVYYTYFADLIRLDIVSTQMDPARRKAPTRSIPKLGKGKHISRTDSLLKRQSE